MTHSEEHEEKKHKGSLGSMIKGLIYGSLIGAGIAFLSAPRTGDETRRVLRTKGYEIRDRAEEAARPIAERASELIDRGQTVYSQQKHRVESVVAGLQEGTRTYIEEGQERSLSTDLETAEMLPYDSEANPATHDPLDEPPPAVM